MADNHDRDVIRVRLLRIVERYADAPHMVRFDGFNTWFNVCDMGPCGTCGGLLFARVITPRGAHLRCNACSPARPHKGEELVAVYRMPKPGQRIPEARNHVDATATAASVAGDRLVAESGARPRTLDAPAGA